MKLNLQHMKVWCKKYGLICISTILIIILLMCVIMLYNKKQEQQEVIGTFSAVMNHNNVEIQELNAYILRLEKENTQLKTQTKKDAQILVEYEQKLSKKTSSKNLPTTQDYGLFKSYTDYNCLSKQSAQWKLQQKAYTDSNGLRKIGDAYLVALGSYYGTELGAKYTVTLSNGNSFEIMLCDFKANAHTDSTNRFTSKDGSVLEFYVDSKQLPRGVKLSGSISSIAYFNGSVVSIVKK